MANAVEMIERCGHGQRPKFTGPACEHCGERATQQMGAMDLCWRCAEDVLTRRHARRDV